MAEQSPYGVRQAIEAGRRTGIYPLPTPPGMPKTRYDPTVDDSVQEAVEEIRDLPDLPYPSMADVAVNHPGALGYQVMTDDEYQNVNKYDMLMRRLATIQSENPSAFENSPFAMGLTGGTPAPVQDRGPFPVARDLSKPVPPYRHRGVLASGQPIRNFAELWMAPFSAVANNVIRPAYDLDKAVKVQPSQFNTITGGLSNLVQGKEMNPEWSGEREFAGQSDFTSPQMLVTRGDPAKMYKSNEVSGTVDGAELLEDMGYPDHWSRMFLGMALEAPLDPATASLGLIGKNLARSARYASPAARAAALRAAGMSVGGELAAPAALTGGIEAAKALNQPSR